MPGPTTQTTPDGLKLEQFGGMLPAWDDTLIPQGQAASSLNGYLFSGALTGWRKPTRLRTLTNSAAKFAYRLPTTSKNIASAILYVIAPVAGDTVTLGEEVYTFVVTPAAAYEVALGANVTAAVTNLFNAFTVDNGENTNAGITYGVGTYANPAINQTRPITTAVLAVDVPRIQVFAPEDGAAYNGTLVGDTTGGARLQWRYNDVATTHLQGGANLAFDAGITSDSTWLEFVDPDTDVVRSPVVDDSFDRYYFASPSIAPTYNTRARIEAGLPAWLLGVPTPGCSPGVAVTGGGEELVAGDSDDTLTTSGYTPGNNGLHLQSFMSDGALSLNNLSVISQASPNIARLRAVLYSDRDGVPDELLATGEEVLGFVAGTPITSEFLNPPGLLAKTQYWIGFITNALVGFQQADGVTADALYHANTYDNGPPGTAPTMLTGKPRLLLYGDTTSSAILAARSYTYTYVTEYDEESAPAEPTVLTGWANGVWTLTLNSPPPDEMGVTRNVTQIRIYRTVSAFSGQTTYFHVADVPVTTETYEDLITDDVIVLNYELQSQLWTPPPPGLLGFQSMPNGMVVGFKDNELWFSEPYRPHAWPTSYVLTSEYPIVGIGITGNAVVACTTGAPYVAFGSSPATMSATKVQKSEPCHSRGSILGTHDGVYYMSPNGLILVSSTGNNINNTSETWITREKWRALTPQKNVRAVPLVSCYYALGCVRNGDASVAQQGFTIELGSQDGTSFTIWPQPGGHRLGFNKLNAPNGVDVDNLFIDPWSSTCLLIENGAIDYFDFSDQAPTMQTYIWRSKLFQQKSARNFEAMRIAFTIPAGTPALNATRLEADTDDPVWASLPADRYGFIRVYSGDGTLLTVREIRTPMEVMRILSGYKTVTWQWEIEARVPIANIQIGTSLKALAQI